MFLEPLKYLPKLTNLHAEANAVKSFKCIKGLENCEHLRTMYF